jgi:hypothetical protein
MTDKTADVRLVTSEMLRRVNEDGRRIRLLEQRMERVDSSVGGLEEHVLSQLEELKLSAERLGDKILKIGERLNSIDNEIEKLTRELGKTATKAEMKQIETFMNIVNPITSKFVTRDEVERMFEDNIRKSRKA